MQSLAIGIDLGCTNIKGVLLNASGNILAETSAETHEQEDSRWKHTVFTMINNFKIQAGGKVDAIGLCAPGLADVHNRCISYMPARLPGLENFVWSDWIGENVTVVNDAHAAMMAEATFGAAKGMQHAFLLSLGTGVGGGLLLHGKLFQGMAQMAGHLGHTTVDADSPWRDITNMPGSLEDAIGNATLSLRSNGKYVSTEDLVNDFKRGDYFATWVWLSSIRKLAVAIASLIHVISPEVVILSGGMIKADRALLAPLEDFLACYEWRPGEKRTAIKLAQFADRAGAIGAAGFALSTLK